MSLRIEPYDVTLEADMRQPQDFNSRSRLRHVDRLFKAEITNVVALTDTDKLFQIHILDPLERATFSFRPGQFVMVDVPGYGEIPVSISSSPLRRGMLELCIRRVGSVTGVLDRARVGARIGLRGPFGSHFPLEKMRNHHVLLIAGGLGVAPLRSPLYHIIENRSDFRDVHLVYGTKNPDQLLFKYQYDQWRHIDRIQMWTIVEEPTPGWNGDVGLITDLLDRIVTPMTETYAIVCGPPVMFKFVCDRLNRKGMPMHRMFVSLERRMHCGMGKCCRCAVGSTYTCIDGPVFDYWSVMNLKEAI